MKSRKVLLYLIAFISGGVVLALEIVAGRFLQPAFGNTVQVWGIVIGIFLTGLSIGYYLGGQIADRLALFAAFSALLYLSAVILFALPLYATAMRDAVFDALDLESVETIGPLLASLGLFLAPTIVLGMVSPYAVRLLADDPAKLGRQVGMLYAVSTLGSILGAIGTSFFLIDWIGSKDAFVFLGAIQLLLSALALWLAASELGRRFPA